MTLRSDSQGFLIGELVESSNEQIDVLKTGNRTLGRIDSNVSAIARALGVAARSNGRVQEPAGRGSGGGGRSGARGGAGAVSGGRSMPAQRSGFGAPNARATVSPSGRDSRGRFVARTGSPQGGDGGRDDKGRFTGDKGSDGGSGSGGLMGRLGGLTDAIKGMGNGADQMDPALTAMSEVKSVVEPLGRGMFALFGRNKEQKKERWYNRIWKTLTNIEKKPAGGGPGGMPMDAGDSSVMGGVAGLAARFLPAILTAVGAVLAIGIGALAGTAIGTALYDWLTKSGLMAKIFDSIDFVIGKFKKIPEAIKETKDNFNKGENEVLNPVKYAPPLLDASGRNLNDPRRLDQATAVGPDGRMINDPRRLDAVAGELPPSTSVAQSLGRGKGYVGKVLRDKMGYVPLTDENDPTKNVSAKLRARKTGDAYSAGNIGGLNDATTRALVASTALTESGGGKLDVVNSAGYMGRYQAGAGWLADAGLIKGGGQSVKDAMKKDGFSNEYKWGQSGGMTKFLKNDANWKDGMNYQGYLGSAKDQDAAFKTNSDASYKAMMANGMINANTPQSEVAGLLKARHISGMGGAKSVAMGGNGPSDANGTSARKYFNDLSTDRNGFVAAYSAPSTPSSVPSKIPAAPDVQIPIPSTAKDRPMEVSVRQPIGQEVSDRGIAQIAGGGIGRPRGW
jgi:hypothetical protein